MKNAIQYYYNMIPDEIHQINKIYKFTNLNNRFILYPFNRDINELEEIYDLHLYMNYIGIYCHRIILNNNNQIITMINGMAYVLLQINITNRKINIEDIILTSNIPINEEKYTKIKRINWHKLWSNKIDYMEYQISQFGKKFPLIRESSAYYIGIVENCITMLINENNKNYIKGISHKRIDKDTMTEEYYNPLNFIIDKRIRDISEYLKSFFLRDLDALQALHKYINNVNLNNEEKNFLFARIMYPSKYIDQCELILNGKIKESELKKTIEKIEQTERNIRKIYEYLKKNTKMQEIEWILKK